MRNSLLAIALAWCAVPLLAQDSVNVRFTLGYLANLVTAINGVGSKVYLKGVYTDSAYLNGTYWAVSGRKLDSFSVTEYLRHPLIETSAWFTANALNPNGNFVFGGDYMDRTMPDTTIRSAFVREVSPEGDSIREIAFFSPYAFAGEAFIAITDIIVAKNGDYLLCGNLDELSMSEGGFVARLGPDMQMKYLKTVGGEAIDENIQAVVELANGNILLAGGEGTGSVGQNLINRSYFVLLDSTGQQVLDEWRIPAVGYPVGAGAIRDMVELPDGSVVGVGTVTREGYVNPGTNFVYKHPSTIRVDGGGNLMWRNSMGSGYYKFFGLHDLNNVFYAPDNTIVAGGSVFYQIEEDTLPGLTSAVVQKMTLDGDSIWLRYVYQPLVAYGSYADIALYDMSPAADGSGYWLCGTSTLVSFTEPHQHGWAAFVDNHGCVVPGCHLVNSSQPGGTDLSTHILLYPNPVTTTLAVYHGGYAFSQGTFQIVDAAGRVLQTWRSPINDQTAMISVQNWPSGTYVLQYVEPGKEPVSKVFVKE